MCLEKAPLEGRAECAAAAVPLGDGFAGRGAQASGGDGASGGGAAAVASKSGGAPAGAEKGVCVCGVRKRKKGFSFKKASKRGLAFDRALFTLTPFSFTTTKT